MMLDMAPIFKQKTTSMLRDRTLSLRLSGLTLIKSINRRAAAAASAMASAAINSSQVNAAARYCVSK